MLDGERRQAGRAARHGWPLLSTNCKFVYAAFRMNQHTCGGTQPLDPLPCYSAAAAGFGPPGLAAAVQGLVCNQLPCGMGSRLDSSVEGKLLNLVALAVQPTDGIP